MRSEFDSFLSDLDSNKGRSEGKKANFNGMASCPFSFLYLEASSTMSFARANIFLKIRYIVYIHVRASYAAWKCG